MNDAYIFADFLEDNRHWTNQQEADIKQIEATFITSLFDHEFRLEPLDGAAFTHQQGIDVLLGGEHVFNKLKDTHIEYWIGTLNAIIQGERTHRGYIKQCISNGALKAVLQKFDSDEYYKIFPEELDFTLDNKQDSALRARGVNPASTQYVDSVNERRIALGVKPYMPKESSPEHHINTPSSMHLLTSQEYMLQKVIM
ncbi:hypothetical protein [Vibrio sp. THAF190c]|uniref:hypothetical protein n=1 Tax=Vibrio sp. THAF190c TaxID=2587865 RepID=UPI001267C762|nr:hypothetical protein [Vibrio sp. THAF190c]QFT13537.1 hypothetical protein FIV04_26640 [Vibrio sp. THAF190c]